MDAADQGSLKGKYQALYIPSHQPAKRSRDRTRTILGLSLLVFTVLLSACTAPTTTPSPTFPPAPTSTQASISAQQPAVTVSLDPCQLVPSSEASSLAGTSFGPGAEGTLSGGGKTCTYGSQTTNVFYVEVAQAPDVATAQADKAAFQADIQANLQQLANAGLTVTELPNFADGATLGQVAVNSGGVTLAGSAIGVLKGTTFFGFSDLDNGTTAPSNAALQAEATTVLGRIP